MKLLLVVLSGCVLLTSSLLSAELTRTGCNCVSCGCTKESHCGCLAQKGCQCNQQHCQCSKNCRCGDKCQCGAKCACQGL